MPKEQKMNHGGGSCIKTIEDLDDNVLTQILFRLPSCPPIVAYKLVNKRWCSLISDPKFPSHFYNHKKGTFSEPGCNINDDEPPWTFISNLRDGNGVPGYEEYCVGNASNNESVFGSPKFSMGFLPSDFLVETTFKDLVLCSTKITSAGGRVFYITNPLTKQWVVLPPCPPCVVTHTEYGLTWELQQWVGLVCQEPYECTQDYKFRVVVVVRFRRPFYELLVYCSEIGEWKKCSLIVSIERDRPAQMQFYSFNIFKCVVCNGIIYLHHNLCFASFNPFDLDVTTDTIYPIKTKVFPTLPYPLHAYLCESSGQLFLMHHPDRGLLDYQKIGTAIKLPLVVWKLDPNVEPLIWEKTFEGSFTGNVNKKEGICIERNHGIIVSNVGMHPNNDKLIYMHLHPEEQLVVCDTRTRLIKPLKSLPGCCLESFDRLELQWWPTSVPRL